MHTKKLSSGFTLVELLIVIVVIAILAAITIVAYNGVQAKARDSSRTSAVKSIQKALELYKAENGSYPAAYPYGTGTNVPAGFSGIWGTSLSYTYSIDTTGGWLKNLTKATAGGAAILSNVPVDPTNDNNHYFVYYASDGMTPADCNQPFYILTVQGYENASDIPASSHGVNCTSESGSANWTTSSSRAIFSNIKGQ